MMGNGVIYKCTNKLNGKIYIGKTTKSFEGYCRKNILNALNRTDVKHGQKRRFYCALRKYGQGNFKWEVIERCGSLELNDREIYWIDFFDSFRKGYNLTKGGDGGGGIPYKRTNEIKSKISKSLMGNKRSEESITRQSNTMKGSNHPLFGIGHRKDSIEKMKEAKKGLKNPNSKIFEFISPDGKIYVVEAGFNKFCLEHHLWHNAMTEVSRGLKEHHKGWKCRSVMKDGRDILLRCHELCTQMGVPDLGGGFLGLVKRLEFLKVKVCAK